MHDNGGYVNSSETDRPEPSFQDLITLTMYRLVNVMRFIGARLSGAGSALNRRLEFLEGRFEGFDGFEAAGLRSLDGK